MSRVATILSVCSIAIPLIASRSSAGEFDFDARAQHWSFQPLTQPPAGASIDSFTGETARPADRRTLIRRLHFDLTGLPPTAADLDKGIEETIDELLASPRFGERWARHWLDVVRFSETKGHVTDTERPFVWKYRDYVIDVFNGDVPYDRFVKEHVAGDLLDPRPGKNGETNVAPTATGALFFHEMHFMAVDPVKQRWDEIDAQIDVVSKAFLGLTASCARCHDHKTDAIRQKDYYALAGIFYSTELGTARTAPRSGINRAGLRKAEVAYESFLSSKRQARVKAQNPKNKTGGYFPISAELGIQTPGDSAKLAGLMRSIDALDPSWSQWVRAATEANATDVPLLSRGDHTIPADPVPRRFLEVLAGPEAPELGDNSGRLYLAEKIADPDNPLTARVWANRIWQHLTGAGIVATPNNFGITGAKPSDAALLDYLAARLIDSGWSTKALIREIVASDTYRALRQHPRRLEAEAIRDAVLAASGTLDLKSGGPSVDVYIPPYATANKPGNIPKSGPLDGDGRRSIYIKVRRGFFDPFLKTFDFPEPGLSTGVRTVTNTPAQALAMLNSPFIHGQTQKWGKKVAAEEGALDEKIDSMFLAAIARRPDSEERQLIHSLAADYVENTAQRFAAIGHVILNMPEFRYVD